jgi:tRNA threonylcarbamoyladenosine biosynthesis protein TsaB
MKGTLYIDTSAVDTTVVRVMCDGKSFEKSRQSRILKSQTVLPLIEELLAEHHMTLTDITAITVATGPGSFTGLRVGATIANTLGTLLDIPVNGKKALVNLTYS